ncbi:hypothetical protein [Asticcacaulis sp. AC402]|uniref:hypothetical protein n=1 Tax=Asticcacaulis sp. AC402 TaxID=1282361 RepID=UPI0012DD6E28|nr:hypothetical protein [Asticcacaulis sp. AC402]
MAVAFLELFYFCRLWAWFSETPARTLTIFAAGNGCSIFALSAVRLGGAGILAFLLLLILLIQKNAPAVKPEIDIYVNCCEGRANLQKFPNESAYKSYILLRLLCGLRLRIAPV